MAPKKHLFKWGLIFAAVSFLWHPVLRTINYAFSRLMHLEVNQVVNKNTVPQVAEVAAAVENAPRKFTEAMLTSVPAPTGLKPELLAGKHVHFMWNPVPGCIGYNFYSAESWETNYHQENKKPITMTEAWWHSDTGPADYKFVITALDGHDHESAYSEPIDVDLR